MSKLSFVKYHGLGNDFILVDNTKAITPVLSSEQASKLCNRNFGIGADGVIFALPGLNGCDYTMRIYNSDGSEPQMCGNGIRCLAKFLQRIEKRTSDGDITYQIWTNAGEIVLSINIDGGVTVDMGEPIFDSALIPTSLKPTIDYLITKNDEKIFVPVVKSATVNLGCVGSVCTTAVGMGNPHSVAFVDSLVDMKPPFEVMGPAMQGCLSAFPERVNAEFVQVHSRNHVKVQVWERGAGPTLACGTGACAVVVAGVLNDLTDRQCTVTLPGGDLIIHWSAADNHVYMTGPAVEVFSGEVQVP